MKTFTKNEEFTINGKTFKYSQDSSRNGGGTHVFAFDVERRQLCQVAISDIDVEEVSNERAQAFINHHGEFKAVTFMAFIADMKRKFFNTSNAMHERISNHDDFTKFIKDNAHKWEGA